MKPPQPQRWTPSPELLAAFADGELDSRLELRLEIEGWLAAHPEANAELEAQRELARLMAETTPPDPAPAAWAKMLSQIVQPRPLPRNYWPAVSALAGVAAAMFLVVNLLNRSDEIQPVADGNLVALPQLVLGDQMQASVVPSLIVSDNVLHMATDDDVHIISVAGADTSTLVVGHSLFTQPVALLRCHEVMVQPPAHSNCRTCIHVGTGSVPMAWTPLPDENEESRK